MNKLLGNSKIILVEVFACLEVRHAAQECRLCLNWLLCFCIFVFLKVLGLCFLLVLEEKISFWNRYLLFFFVEGFFCFLSVLIPYFERFLDIVNLVEEYFWKCFSLWLWNIFRDLLVGTQVFITDLSGFADFLLEPLFSH